VDRLRIAVVVMIGGVLAGACDGGGTTFPSCCQCTFSGTGCSAEATIGVGDGDLGASCEEVCRGAGIQCPFQSAEVCEGAPFEPPPMVLVAGGSFTMGSPVGELGRADDEDQHEVTLTRAFHLQEHPATQAEWRSVMGTSPSTHPGCGDDCPLETITWWDALAYANAISLRTGLPECYTLSGCSGTPGSGQICTAVTVNATGGNPLDCAGYRLPTEAEWELAYRAGTTTAIYNGDLSTTGCSVDATLDEIGWYCGNADATTHPVGQKVANPLGLTDMSGNVYDWVWDWYGTYPGTVTDPTGPASGTLRVLRGGSWESNAEWCRAAFRHAWDPGDAGPHFGVRLARTEE